MIRARYEARVELSDLDPPNSLRLSGSGTSAMGSAQGGANVRLSPLDGDRTRLDYEYEASVGGRIASVGGRMLQGAARVIVNQIFSRLAQRFGGGAGAGQCLQGRLSALVARLKGDQS